MGLISQRAHLRWVWRRYTFPADKKLAKTQLGKRTAVLQTVGNGRFGEWQAQELRALVGDSFGVPDSEVVYSVLLLMQLEQMQHLLDSAASPERRMEERFSQFDSTLTSIPGVGSVLGAMIPGEIRDISCFTSVDKLAAYTGVDPRVKQSGEMKPGGVHMSRRSYPCLRRATCRAGVVAVQCDPMFLAYHKKAAEGMRYRNIIGHMTRKMAAVIFAVMRDNKIDESILPAT